MQVEPKKMSLVLARGYDKPPYRFEQYRGGGGVQDSSALHPSSAGLAMILLVLYMGFPPTLGDPVAFFVVMPSVLWEKYLCCCKLGKCPMLTLIPY